MKKIFVIIMICILVAGFAYAAAEKGTTQEAKAMVGKAVAFYEANGQAKAFQAFNDPKGKFVDRDLYIYVMDMNGKVLSHGTNPKLIGKDLLELKDSDGKAFVKEIIAAVKAKGNGWSDYKWTNPLTKKIDAKTAYFQKTGNVIIVCGAYK